MSITSHNVSVLKGLVTRKVNKLTKQWNRRYCVYVNPRVVFFEKGTDGGYAIEDKVIGFNLRYLKKYRGEFIDTIVPHEIAHAFQHRLYPNDYHHHSKHWKTLCQEMGGTGDRYHYFED